MRSLCYTLVDLVVVSPKRNVAGSIPVGDATNNAESLDFSRFSAFFIYGLLSLLKKDFFYFEYFVFDYLLRLLRK